MDLDEEEEIFATHSALFNDCFLGRLFEFVDVPSLKQCRKVCHKWNTVAGISLRKTSYVKINAYEELETFDGVMSRSLDQSTKTIRKFFFRIFEHQLSGELLLNTCSRYRNTITSIKIWFLEDPMYANSDARVFAECLTSLPELNELAIEDVPVMQLQVNAFNGLVFPKLRSISVTSNDYVTGTYPEGDFITSLLGACAPTITNLELGKVSQQFVEHLFEAVNLSRIQKLKFGADPLPLTLPIDFIQKLPRLLPRLNTFDYCSSTTRLESDEVRRVMEAMSYVPNIRLKGFVPAYQLAVLPKVKQLELNLRYSGTMGELVKCLPNIEVLHVHYASSLSDPWQEMKYLKELLLNGSHPTFHLDSMSTSTFPSLTKLSIKLSTGQLTPIFANLPTLIELNILRGSMVTDEDLTGIRMDKIRCDTFKPKMRKKPYVGNLKNLRVLNIGSCFLSSKCIQYGIADVPTLTNLTMTKPAATLVRSSSSSRVNRIITFRGNSGQNLFDLQPLFPPNLPYLVQFTLVAHDSSACPFDDIQVTNLKKLRPDLYLRTEIPNEDLLNDPAVVDFHLGMW